MEETMRKTIAFMTATVLALPLGGAMADQGTQGTKKDRSGTQGNVQGSQAAPSGATGSLMASDDIIGSKVRDTNGEDLGSIDDLLVRQDGKIEAAVIQLGGVLGIGGRQVKVPWDSLKLQRQTGDPDDYFVTASRQTLQGAPAFDEDRGVTASRGADADADDPRSARTTGDEPMNPAR
jgi:sporulation protein YlmC with PRC-barrel domain